MIAPAWARRATYGMIWIAALVVAILGSSQRFGGDYWHDAYPALVAAADGDLGALITGAEMGPLSLILRFPAFLLVETLGGDPVLGHITGALLCVTLALGILFVSVPALARRAGSPMHLVLLAGASPLAMYSMKVGHPEEVLTGALCIGALAAASKGRVLLASLAFLAAVATKQWAVVAFVPVLAAAGPRWGSVFRRSFGIALSLGLIAALATRGEVIRQAAEMVDSNGFVSWTCIWWHLVPDGGVGIDRGGWVGLLNDTAHLITVLVATLVPLAFWLRLKRRSSDPVHLALVLMALAFTLRCTFDTWNNIYYHLPALLVIALVELREGRFPVVAWAASAISYFFMNRDFWLGGPELTAPAYMIWVLPLFFWTFARLRSNKRPWGLDLRVKFSGPSPIRVR